MLWIKAFHIIFMVTWFAGLFYLPRLFVYHADASDPISNDRFKIMERRLSIMMSIGAFGTIAFGLWLLIGPASYAASAGWFHVKLLLVLLLIGYHGYCQVLVKKFRNDANTRSARFYRLFNELPAVALIAMVILVVVKPF